MQTEDETPLLCPLCGARVREGLPDTDGADEVGRLERHFLRDCLAPGPMS